jgi:hypothetical protein
LEHKIKRHRPCAERPVKPLTAHRRVVDHGHPVVDALNEPIRSRGDDGEGVKLAACIAVEPTVPQSREGERLTALEIKPHRQPSAYPRSATHRSHPPERDNAASLIIRCPMERSCAHDGTHWPNFVAHNHRHVLRSRYVVARVKVGEVPVKIPRNLYVAVLE